jgi:hypothetical protein
MKKIIFLLILLIVFINGISQTTVIRKDSIPIYSIIFSEFETILDDYIENQKQYEYLDSIGIFEIVMGLNNDSDIYIMFILGREMSDIIFMADNKADKKSYICFYYKNHLFIVFMRSDLPIQKLFNITTSKQIIYFNGNINNNNNSYKDDDSFFSTLWIYIFKDGSFYEGRKFEGNLPKKGNVR